MRLTTSLKHWLLGCDLVCILRDVYLAFIIFRAFAKVVNLWWFDSPWIFSMSPRVLGFCLRE
jgi:hypothetical protein